MIVTYERGRANFTRNGNGWKTYRWWKKNDTLIISNLWQVIDKNLDDSFDEICNKIKTYYNNKTEKSRVEITVENGILEIIRKGIFPNIIIEKDGKK